MKRCATPRYAIEESARMAAYFAVEAMKERIRVDADTASDD